MQADDLQLYDIVDMPHVPWWQQPWFYLVVVVLILLLALVLWLMYRFLTRRKYTPFDRAVKELERIRITKLRTQEDHKKYYVTLSRLLKKFLFEQFGYNVQGKTDHELLEFLKTLDGFPQDLFTEIRTLLQGLDSIKFAEQEAALEKIRADYARIMQIFIRGAELFKEWKEKGGA